MRNPRLIAAHRGGPLSKAHHRALAAWAADCADGVLAHFEAHSQDERPRRAIEVGRAWSRGEVPVGAAQKASVAAHAAAREATGAAAIAAARSAGQGVATAHFAEHALGAFYYAMKASKVASLPLHDEYRRLMELVPTDLRELIESAIAVKYPKLLPELSASHEGA